MSIDIRRIDPADTDAIRAWHRLYEAVGRHDHPDSFVVSPVSEVAHVLATPTVDHEFVGWLGSCGGETVASGWYAGMRRTNTDRALMTPRVHPDHRGQGFGSAMLAHLEEFARNDGRRRVISSPRWSADFGPTGVGAPNVDFALKHGYRVGLVEASRRLDLPVDPAILRGLIDAAEPTYTVRAFAGPIPGDLVRAWAEIEASLTTEAPTGDVDWDHVPPDVDSVREQEQILAEAGATKFNAVVVAPDGEVVGYSDIVVAPGEPAAQWGTLVKRAHRGRHLGGAVKAAVVDLIQTTRPDVTAAVTSNAMDNAAMVAVNDRLGYRVVSYSADVEASV